LVLVLLDENVLVSSDLPDSPDSIFAGKWQQKGFKQETKGNLHL
jgi:hypothetical protein